MVRGVKDKFLVRVYENGELVEEEIRRDLRARPDEPNAFSFIDEALFDLFAIDYLDYGGSDGDIWGYFIDVDNNKVDFKGYYGKDYAVVEFKYGNKKYRIEIEELFKRNEE
jgi:hypothetical protein